MPNCETCLSAANCSKCKDDFVWDPVSVQCLKTSDLGGSVAIQGDQVIKCPFECLACTAAGVCTKCLSGFALSVGTCVACGSNCKTCASSNISSCTSCSSGYFLNKTECVPCNQTNCQDCSLSSSVCVKCADGFFMNETECQPCKG
jgi:proprotein convertase subtilisin/kexin type 5